MPSFSVVLVSTFALAATFVSAALAANAGLEKRFTPGFCVVCVTQYQKNENGVGAEYEYDIQLTDGAALDIGGVNRQPIPDGGFFDLESQAPDVLVIQSGGIDNNPIGFRYNGDSWTSDDTGSHACSTGAYDSGNRDLSCGFAC